MKSLCIDCHYLRPGKASVYLLVNGGEAAFVDVNAPTALPHLLAALEEADLSPEAVRYLLLTHVHLDHGGGAGAMIEACPNAEVIVHPAGRPHLLEPERLVQASRMVYGKERFIQLYGTITALPPKRVRAVEDNEEVLIDGQPIACLHTPGHTKHHLCFHDHSSGTVYSGDVLGSCYAPHREGTPPLAFCAIPPTDFDLPKMRATVGRIETLKPTRLGPTHFGFIDDPAGATTALRRSIDAMEQCLEAALDSGLEAEALEAFSLERVFAAARGLHRHCGLEPAGPAWDLMEGDLRMNAQGIAHRTGKLRAK